MTVKGSLSTILRRKKSVITRAHFWKVPHNNSEDEINLKVGRYSVPKEFYEEEVPETLNPKSELTLDSEEFKNLIEFIQKNYEPFERENAEQIKALFALPNRSEIIKFVVENRIVPDDLYLALQATSRGRAITQFEEMLTAAKAESAWQAWFKENSWVLGSEFVRILDERAIDTQHISDFLMEAYDGFLDIVEKKGSSPIIVGRLA